MGPSRQRGGVSQRTISGLLRKAKEYAKKSSNTTREKMAEALQSALKKQVLQVFCQRLIPHWNDHQSWTLARQNKWK